MFDNPYMALAVCFPIAYLIGSTPFGWLIARGKGVDLRKSGSGNVGATNVGRVLGRRWGYLCFFLDMAKGLLPTLAIVLLTGTDDGKPTPLHQAVWLAVGAGAIIGHVFSFWLKFRGGKGVATSLGVVLGIYPYFTLAGLAAFALWIAITLISRYVSLGSVIAALSFVPLVAAFHWDIVMNLWPLLSFATTMMILIIVKHLANIRRLIAGTENKIGSKTPK